MLLSPPAPWPRVEPVRLNRLPQRKGRLLSLPRSRWPRSPRRLGLCMVEMDMVGSGSSREPGASAGEGEAMLGGDKLPGPRAEAAATRWTPVEAALNGMSKWLVAGSFAFVALWKRDSEIMWALMGAHANSVLSSVLKKLLNHERPAPALRSDPGMPSSHAQSIFYAATLLVLSVMATDIAASPHTEPGSCGRYCRISLQHYVVCTLAFVCAGSFCFLVVGQNSSRPWFRSVLCCLRRLHHSAVVQG
ncbi:hypothetical protein ACQJBY_058421 [Aegilops geniculata]